MCFGPDVRVGRLTRPLQKTIANGPRGRPFVSGNGSRDVPLHRIGYQTVVSPLTPPDRMASRTSSIVASPPGAVPPHSKRVAAGVQ